MKSGWTLSAACPSSSSASADILEICRANVRAVCEAKIDQHQLAAEIPIGSRPAGVIDEAKGAAYRLATPHKDIHDLGSRTLLGRHRLEAKAPRKVPMRARTVSHAERYAAAGRRDQQIVGHLRSRLRNEIEPAAMHREKYIWLELLDLADHLREVILWCRAQMKSANYRMYLVMPDTSCAWRTELTMPA